MEYFNLFCFLFTSQFMYTTEDETEQDTYQQTALPSDKDGKKPVLRDGSQTKT